MPGKRTRTEPVRTVVATIALLSFGGACAPSPDTGEVTDDAVTKQRQDVEVVVPGSISLGIHGLTVTRDGRLLVGSVVGQSIYQVDPESGEHSVFRGPPDGIADDLEEGPDGTLAWTSFLSGQVHAMDPDGAVRVLADGLPAINSIAWSDDGRLFATQVFGGDALWEIDPAGEQPPRKILEGMGGLNGFDIGPDGKLYGPLWFRGQVARVDVDSGALEVVADGFAIPAAVNFDSQGRLYAVDTQRGEVVRIDPATGAKTVVATVRPSIDNLAFSPDDRLFLSNMAYDAIYEIDPETGSSRTVLEGKVSAPAGLALWEDEAGATLYLADVFAYRTIDAATGEVTTVRTMFAQDTEELDYPISATVDEDHVILTSWSSATVQVLDRPSGESLEMLHGFAAPTTAVELPDGRLVVADLGANALLMVAADDRSERTAIAQEIGAPVAMLRWGDGAVLLTDSASGAVVRYDLASGERTTIAQGLAGPEGIDVLPDGRLVVAEVGNHRLVAIDPESGALEELSRDLPIGLAAPPGNPPAYVPTGVAAARDGAVYLTSDLEAAVYRVWPGR